MQGHPRDYDCLIQRIEGWSGFMAMWSGVATQEQARRMVEEHLKNEKTLAAAVTRDAVAFEDGEDVQDENVSSNPSNWDEDGDEEDFEVHGVSRAGCARVLMRRRRKSWPRRLNCCGGL